METLVSQNIEKIVRSHNLSGKGRLIRFDVLNDHRVIITISGADFHQSAWPLEKARGIYLILFRQGYRSF